MAIVLALGAAAFYGSADYVGGMAARRRAVIAVALGAQVSGLLVLLVGLAVLGPTQVTGHDMVLGAAAGLFGGVGLVAIYHALAQGPMSVVAPTSALSASAVPVVAGLFAGERPGLAALAGIVVALAAVVMVTWERVTPGTARRVAPMALVSALAGGGLFGLFFVLHHQTGSAAGLWPLLASRLVSVPVLALLARQRSVTVGLDRGFVGSVAVSGTLDMLANIAFVVATRHGMLSVVSALTGLYPATTVLLAQTHLGERLGKVQMAGLGVAAAAAVLIAV